MCTVSYIPNKDIGGFVLTSNRDEKVFRPTDPPEIYNTGEISVGFPKDQQGGGSWIAASNHGRLSCLLNGAFIPHQKRSQYEQSRGKILIEVVSASKSPYQYFVEKDLMKTEPFTIITLERSNCGISHFSEFIWDGTQKHFKLLNPEKPQIWSSVTLYSKNNRDLRQQWFNRFLKKANGNLSAENIFDFHSGTHTGDNSVNLVMEREGGIKTVSITQVVPENDNYRMKYFDLQHQQNSSLKI